MSILFSQRKLIVYMYLLDNIKYKENVNDMAVLRTVIQSNSNNTLIFISNP